MNQESSSSADSSPQQDTAPEYLCKYCAKKFTNKQALGGHQNAHKFERMLQKSEKQQSAAAAAAAARAQPSYGDQVHQGMMSSGNYFPNSFSTYSGADYLSNQAPMSGMYPPCPISFSPYAVRPMLPPVPQGPSGFDYHGWQRPPSVVLNNYPMEVQNPIRNSVFPQLSSNNMNDPAMLRVVDGPSNAENTDENNPQEEKELDLTLKL